MAVFKCKMCGGNLEVQEGMTVCECEYCGSTQTVPSLDDEKKITLFTRANRLRSACEFDKASGVYESIVTEFCEEAEAYWGLILCKYGIEYVDDPKTAKKIPTCHRSSFDNVMDDENFEMVMEYSDPTSRAVYREEAKAIEELRMGIIEVSSKEAPYDIFICYKETDAMGERTIDSVLAQDVYDVLTEKGYRVFFSCISLEDKLGQEYEPYIFAALNSAKVMLAFGTDYEYYNAVWVKNEWSRFLSLIEKGEKKTLIPCFKGIDAYDMPREFARLQAQDMGKVGAIQDLVRGIGKILGAKTTQPSGVSDVLSAEGFALTKRGNMALEDGDFERAEGYFERALDANPSDAYAYLGKFLAFYGLKSLADLGDKVYYLLDENKEFRRAEQFADAKLASELKVVRESNALKIERLKITDTLKKLYKKKAASELDKKNEALHKKNEAFRRSRQEEKKQIIGKNEEYYLPQLRKIQAGERGRFNWAAFFFGLYHAAYRGVWRHWLSFMKVPLIIGTVALGVSVHNGESGSTLMTMALIQISSLLSFIFAVRYGKRFNHMYMNYVEQRVAQGRLTDSVSWKRVLIAVVITVAVGMGICISVSSVSGDASMNDTTQDKWVQNVKNGTNASYPGVTYGEAFKEFFSSPTWSYFKGNRDGLDGQEEYVSVVKFTGGCTYGGEEVTAVIHFAVNEEEETFQAEYLSFDGVEQEKSTLSELICSAFEGAQTGTEPESQITEKMEPKESSTDEDISQRTENTSGYSVPADYIGIWGEAQSDSLHPLAMTIENPNGKYCDISICLWMGNAGGWQLEATGTYDSASNQIVYTDCQEYEIYYDEGIGDLVTELSSSGGGGSIYFQDGYLFWYGDAAAYEVPFQRA